MISTSTSLTGSWQGAEEEEGQLAVAAVACSWAKYLGSCACVMGDNRPDHIAEAALIL